MSSVAALGWLLTAPFGLLYQPASTWQGQLRDGARLRHGRVCIRALENTNSNSGVVELPGTLAEEHFVPTEDEDVTLRVLRWSPIGVPNSASQRPVIFVAGWGSIFEGWRPLVQEWAQRRPIVYIETREKQSAEWRRRLRPKDFAMARHGEDIRSVLHHLQIEAKEVLWFSSSLGATLLLDAFQAGTLPNGRSSVMLAPNPSFAFPAWARPILRIPLPRFVYARLRSLGMWVVRRKTQEPAQRARYERSLASQDLERLVLSMKANLDYQLPADCSRVTMPCAVLAATTDTLHGMDKIGSVVERLPNAKLMEVPTNQYAHEAAVLAQIEPFLAAMAF